VHFFGSFDRACSVVRTLITKKHAARRLLNRTEVAQHLGVRVETVSRWTTAGTIPCVRIGKRSVRYLLPQIVSQLRRRKEGGRK
jgi:excisionase family DNA binding protein